MVASPASSVRARSWTSWRSSSRADKESNNNPISKIVLQTSRCWLKAGTLMPRRGEATSVKPYLTGHTGEAERLALATNEASCSW